VPESEATELFAECRRCVKRINSVTGQTSRASDIKGAARPWVSANLCQTTHHAESGLLEDTPSTATHGGSIGVSNVSGLLLPAFGRVTSARNLACLVEPLAVHLHPRGVLFALCRKLHRIANLLLPVLGENNLRGGRVAVHDD
jgi:hypothetical protein